MSSIPLTQHEFNLLLSGNHPEYEDASDDQYVERGKGSDIHYSREIKRLSDNAIFSIVFTYNSSFEGYQDWIRAGDFHIDENKEDIYDDYGELISKKEDKEEDVVKEETISERYNKMVNNGEIPSMNSPWQLLPLDKFKYLAEVTKDVVLNEPKNRTHTYSFMENLYYEMAIQYKVNAERLWRELLNDSDYKKISIDNYCKKYLIQKELLEKGTYTFKSENGNIELSQKDLEKIKKLQF